MESVPLMWGPVTASPVGIEPMTIFGGGAPPRDGLLGTMRQKALQKAFNRNDLERNKKYSSSGYSSSCNDNLLLRLGSSLVLEHTLASLDKAFAVAFGNMFRASV